MEGRLMITEAEKLEILDELEKRLDGRLKKIPEREVSGRILKAPREKWFCSADGYRRKSLMGEAVGSGVMAQEAWEAIRKLTCAVCGVRKVRELKTVEESPVVAEKICQYIYDLAVEFKEEKKRV
jgi:rubredoxin